jgi:MoaA/NifB/PqqE/SkfB family radical SAM enzyme
MYNYSDITTVHLEMTEACNASCPMCARNLNGGEVSPLLHGAELSITDIERIFPIDFIKQLNRLYMCGNYGDPAVAKDTLEAFAYFREHNANLNLSMHTNGSMKKPEWWAELARVVGKKGYIIFGLDGLEDTNHLYRQGTVWTKIMENAQAFIDAGGRARWDYIVFAHNEHQVEEAEALATKMGFEKFNIKKSNRFFSNTRGEVKQEHQAGNRKGGATTLLAMPSDPKYHNAAIKNLENITKGQKSDPYELITTVEALKEKVGSQKFTKDVEKKKPMEKYWDSVPIKCKVAEEKSIYVTAEGYLQPCCWTAGQMYVWYWKEQGGQIWNAINEAGLESLDLRQHGIKNVVEGKFMQEIIPNSWNKSSCAEGKLAVCAKTCGTKYDAFSEQFK